MLDWITKMFDTDGFPPRWQCGQDWTAFLGWLHILSDIGIWAAYMAIPLAMWYFARKRPDIKLPRVFWLYIAFILACGFTHLIEAAIFYWPIYRVSGLAKLITAVVSLATVFAVVKVLPAALNLPGLAKMNERLKQQITYREQAERGLARANDTLVSRNEELKRFLYSVSHDLKSPVVTIQGFTQFISNDLREGRTDRLQDWARRIEEATTQMSASLEDLLALGRVGYQQAERQPVDLNRLAADVVQSLAPQIEQAQAQVTVQPDLPRIEGSAEQLRRLIQNLIENALAHGKVQGQPLKITVGGKRTRGSARLWVSDNGPGIAPAHAERVFLPFERLQNTTKGSGLGLSIVKRIAENHGAKVWVQDPADQTPADQTPADQTHADQAPAGQDAVGTTIVFEIKAG